MNKNICCHNYDGCVIMHGREKKMLEANKFYLRIVSNLQQIQKEHTELEIKMDTMLLEK